MNSTMECSVAHFALQGLIHKVARFVPGNARLELRIIHQLLRGSEDLSETSFGLCSEERK